MKYHQISPTKNASSAKPKTRDSKASRDCTCLLSQRRATWEQGLFRSGKIQRLAVFLKDHLESITVSTVSDPNSLKAVATAARQQLAMTTWAQQAQGLDTWGHKVGQDKKTRSYSSTWQQAPVGRSKRNRAKSWAWTGPCFAMPQAHAACASPKKKQNTTKRKKRLEVHNSVYISEIDHSVVFSKSIKVMLEKLISYHNIVLFWSKLPGFLSCNGPRWNCVIRTIRWFDVFQFARTLMSIKCHQRFRYVRKYVYIYIGIYFKKSKCYCKLSDQTYPHVFMFFDVLRFF